MASEADGRPQHETPYLHVRAPRRIVGVGGERDTGGGSSGSEGAAYADAVGELSEPSDPGAAVESEPEEGISTVCSEPLASATVRSPRMSALRVG